MSLWERFFAPSPSTPRQPTRSDPPVSLDKAVGEVLSSLGLRARLMHRDHLLTIAHGLNERAGREKDLGHFELAKGLCLRALDIFDNTVPPDHPQLAPILENYASILRAEASLLEARALAIRGNPPVQHFASSPQSDTRIRE